MSSTLRPLVANVQKQLNAISASSAPPTAGEIEALCVSWRALVDALDLPAEVEMRQCPACRRYIRAAATLCGYCWVRVEPTAVL